MAQVAYSNEKRFSCVAVFTSKIGFEASETQKNDLQSFAKSKDLKIITYIDSANYNNLSADQVAERFGKAQQNLVIVWRLDCLPNSIKTMEDVFKIFSTLGKKGISFISVEDKIDTDLDTQSFTIALSSAWTTFKKNRKTINGRASLLKAKSRLRPAGRKKIRDDVLIKNLRDQGLTIREIAREIKLSTTAVQRSLKAYEQTPKSDIMIRTLV